MHCSQFNEQTNPTNPSPPRPWEGPSATHAPPRGPGSRRAALRNASAPRSCSSCQDHSVASAHILTIACLSMHTRGMPGVLCSAKVVETLIDEELQERA